MQGITAMKVPDSYESKNTDEFGTFDSAMTKLLAVPADENAVQNQEAQKAQEEI